MQQEHKEPKAIKEIPAIHRGPWAPKALTGSEKETQSGRSSRRCKELKAIKVDTGDTGAAGRQRR